MTRVQQTYLELLKAAIWGSNSERLADSGELLIEVIRIAAFQGTGPLVYDQLLKLKDVEIPEAMRIQMKQQCMMSMMQQSTMLPILSKAWNALTDADIHPVLLKGLALAQYYPQPHLRQWGDIDLYVGQKQYHQACKVLDAVFPEAEHPSEDDEERKHYNYVFPNTVLELHRISMGFAHPRDKKYYEALEERYLTKDGPSFEVNGLSITTPEETFNLFFTFLHAWHHFIETGMNMKQLCDIAILFQAKREAINDVQLHEMLCKLDLLEPWQLIMYIIVHYLKVPREECPFYSVRVEERANLFFARILLEGLSRNLESVELSEENCIPYLRRKWETFQSRIASSRLVAPYAPRYAQHMLVGNIIHGVERTIKGK